MLPPKDEVNRWSMLIITDRLSCGRNRCIPTREMRLMLTAHPQSYDKYHRREKFKASQTSKIELRDKNT